MKIVIVGGGIAGFSTYLFLHKHLVVPNSQEYSLVIYEAYDIHKLSTKSKPIVDPVSHDEPVFTPAAIGNAIGLGKNGLECLRRIDADGQLLIKMYRRGHPIKKWKMSTARGWDLVDVNMSAMKDQGKMYDSLMIARQAAWEVLRDEVLAINGAAVVQKRVNEIKIAASPGRKTRINFADGTHDEADLLIGADGLRSAVRYAIFQDNTDTEILGWLPWLFGREANKRDYLMPHYEGLTGLGGFIPSKVLQDTGHASGTMGIVFGPNGFFGHGYLDSKTENNHNDMESLKDIKPGGLASWWATFSSSEPIPFPPKEKDATYGKFDQDAALKYILERYRSWQVPTVQGILSHVETYGVEHMYPTYTTPELPTWQRGNVVLVGDAAHAIQPSSGQGACQAFEDAESLALFLKHYLSEQASGAESHAQQLSKALEKFVQFRLPRIHKIYIQSQRMSNMKADMNFIDEMLMYSFLWLATKMNFLKAYNEELFNYNLPREVEMFINM